MATEKVKIDLTFLGQNNIIIYPIYSKDGEKILEARTRLTTTLINRIIKKYGKDVYYSFSEEMDNIPNHRINTAYNTSRDIMEEVANTGKLSKSRYRDSEILIENLLNDLHSTETETIKLLKNLNDFDDYTYNHSVNVLLLTAVFSSMFDDMTQDEIKSLLLGAYLHDIGKMKIDKQLLNKNGSLNGAEFMSMKRHPQLGYEMIKDIVPNDSILQQTILFHHEKFNNQGYYGIPYENLPLYPKMVSICDVFDALTSKRPYRGAISPSDALKIILNSVNEHYDYDLINLFINKMGPVINSTYYFYSKYHICELNRKELGLITDFGKNNILNPEVIVFARLVRKDTAISIQYYKKPQKINLEDDESRIMTNIMTDEYQISQIKDALLERCLMAEQVTF